MRGLYFSFPLHIVIFMINAAKKIRSGDGTLPNDFYKQDFCQNECVIFYKEIEFIPQVGKDKNTSFQVLFQSPLCL
jgi:hypothetical protein